MKVGFIGLGRMGKGMAHRIQGGGHELTVFDVVS
jgi:3-hydroxyisobutyrate dehydrogenase-like beta-hydroxyacid dehydrogenase